MIVIILIFKDHLLICPGSGRGIFAGYYSPSHANVVDVINIDVQGNVQILDLTVAMEVEVMVKSSLTRLIIFGGEKSHRCFRCYRFS